MWEPLVVPDVIPSMLIDPPPQDEGSMGRILADSLKKQEEAAKQKLTEDKPKPPDGLT
jgi:hypothetical protein